jgi:diguanylate cyclase (GGDEF)-like protein
MRLIDRNDTSLAVALVAGTVVIFERPLRLLFETARDVETRYDIDLLPGLAVLVTTLSFHQFRKRQQARQAAAEAAAEIVRERERSAELERLVAFGTALSAATDFDGVRQVFWRFMPMFARDREVWMLSPTEDGWETVIQDATATGPHREHGTLERLAASAAEWPAQEDARSNGIVVGDDVCFPMAVGERPLGVVGVRADRALLASERKALGAATALLASSLRNVQLLAEAREASLRDQLTGCFNRAYAIETLTTELARSRRSGRPLSILMFDIDQFKSTNDEYGHLTGDAILAAVAGQCASTLRAGDIKCRWGGDEFLVVLPDTPLDGAEHAGGAITREVASLRVSTTAGLISPTISVGVAVAGPADSDPLGLITRADRALYDAKQSGRNRFVVAPPAPIRAVS